MSGVFHTWPEETEDVLLNSTYGVEYAGYYMSILKNAIIYEDWKDDGIWVIGRFKASKDDFFRWSYMKSRASYPKLYKGLIEAGALIEKGNGYYEIPRYKKKQDVGITPSQVHDMEEAIQDLRQEISDLREEMGAPVDPPSGKQSGERKKTNKLPSIEDPIREFYAAIGQKRLSKKKLADAQKVYVQLREQYSRNEIQYATAWALDPKRKEKPYSFGYIASIIPQAVAEMEKERAKMLRKAAEVEMNEMKAEEHERMADLRERVEEIKAAMSEGERQELREKAIAELKEQAVPVDFIDFIVDVKENEIIGREL